MALAISTYSNITGSNAFFKAIGHPLAFEQADQLFHQLSGSKKLAIYDPYGYFEAFSSLYDLSQLCIDQVYVQRFEDLTEDTKPITKLTPESDAIFVVAFDADQAIQHIQHVLPKGIKTVTLDSLKLQPSMIAHSRNYLDPLNFSTNFAFFRDGEGHHTRITTANYWSGYGAKDSFLWCRLYDEKGGVLAEWEQALDDAVHIISIDSKTVRERFKLSEFCGQLFIHCVGARGHDVFKYALDTYGDNPQILSSTHDANSFPADLYGGLPAPKSDEQVILWIQNSHPCPIPASSVGLNIMGNDLIAYLDQEIPGFGTYALDTHTLIPKARWPQQFEIRAGKYFVRPRYEIFRSNQHQHMAHANVERTDLNNDPTLSTLPNFWGKGFILPAPILPKNRFKTFTLPTPMTTCYDQQPLTLSAYDANGTLLGEHHYQIIAREHTDMVSVHDLFGEALPSNDWCHMELTYDFEHHPHAAVDGWLHALFRYHDTHSDHTAETSFGAHVFNTVVTYQKEPQSYKGGPPGLSTRLFLRLAPKPYNTFCQLIYPNSNSWHATSTTTLTLYSDQGQEICHRTIEIPLGGSYQWSHFDLFTEKERQRAGVMGYVMIRDKTCRLFGYHGLLCGKDSFSLDHMFGF